MARSSNEAWAWEPDLAHTLDGGRHWTIFDSHATTAGLTAIGGSVWWLYRCGKPTGVPMTVCLARSADNGVHWQRTALPMRDLPDGSDPALLDARFVRSDARDGWMIVDDQTYGWQFWRTVDGAASWQRLPEPCAGPTSQRPTPRKDMGNGTDPRGPLTAVDAQHLFLICTGGAGGGSVGEDLFASNDGGQSWKWTRGVPPQFGNAQSMATPTLDTIVWSGGRTALNVSFDGGRTWTTATSTNSSVAFNPRDGGLASIVFVSVEQAWAIGQPEGDGSVIWHTTDGGHTWTPTLIH